jgi:hypothetical protein
MQHIKTVAVGSGGGTISFDAIPQEYAALQIFYTAKSAVNPGPVNALDYLVMRVNGDATTAYNSTVTLVETAPASSSKYTTLPYLVIGAVSHSGIADTSRFSHGYVTILFYYADWMAKNVISHGCAIDTGFNAYFETTGIWLKNNPITRLDIFSASEATGKLARYSTASLYGLPVGVTGSVSANPLI